MELEKLKEFIRFMDENSLSELEIGEEGKHIRLKKFVKDQPVIISSGQDKPREDAKNKPGDKDNYLEIKSPMVGTFYRSPAPGEKPYVDMGNRVNSGDVICIIEAMKLMNEIKAEAGGKIIRIMVENGDPVEFGQTLFLIDPE